MSLIKRRLIILVSTCLMISGCGIVPPWLSILHTGTDIVMSAETGKTSTEHLASGMSGKDCRWSRVINGQRVCQTPEEEREFLLSLNCETIAWNWLDHPYCKEDKIEEEE